MIEIVCSVLVIGAILGVAMIDYRAAFNNK